MNKSKIKISLRRYIAFWVAILLLLASTPIGVLASPNWEESDFIYEGDLISGFSPSGKAKLSSSLDKTVEIPAGTRAIGRSAFHNEAIEGLVLPAGLERIEPYAFSNNRIIQLDLPNSLRTIESSAFKDNDLIRLDTKNVETIGPSAFQNNNLTQLTLGTNLTSIGNSAFMSNDLTQVEISSNNLSLGKSVFADNNRYVRIIGQVGNIQSEKVPGLYGHIVNSITIVVKYVDKDTGLDIISPKILGDDLSKEGQVYILGQRASLNVPNISGYITGQDKIEFTPDKDNYELKIEYLPVGQAPRLEVPRKQFPPNATIGQAELLDGVKAYDLLNQDISYKVHVSPDNLDSSVGGVKKVIYSVEDDYGNVTTEQVDVFIGTDWNEYELGNGWKVGDFRFNSAGMVLGLSPQGQEKIKTNKNLVLPHINDKGEPVYKVHDYAFQNMDIETLVIPEGYEEIGYNSFKNNKLVELKLPNSIKTIKRFAFVENQLTDLTLSSNIERIEDNAFYKQPLNNFDGRFPDSINYIGRNAFYDSEFSEVYLPASLPKDRVGSGAFRPKYGLEMKGYWDKQGTNYKDYYGVLWNPVENESNTDDSEWLEDDFVWRGDTIFGFSQTGKEKVKTNSDLIIPSRAKKIGDLAFSGIGLTSLTLPEGLEEIGREAFTNNKLESLTLPDSLISLGDSSFLNNELRDLRLPVNLKEIPKQAFNKNKLTKVDLPQSLERIGDRAFEQNEISNLVIPNSVKTIGEYVFYKNKLEKVDLGHGVEKIGSRAFSYNKIGDLDIPDNVKSLGNYVFSYNDIKVVKIGKGLDKIASGTFSNNKLEEINIPDNIISIESSGFSDNKLKKVSFPDTLENIGSYAFYRNYLTEVVMPPSLKKIGYYAFKFNDELEKLILNDGLEEIGRLAFEGAKISELTFPDTLRIIDDHAFNNNKLEKVYLPDSIEKIGSGAFMSNKLTDVRLPKSLKEIPSYTFAYNKIDKLVLPEDLETIGNSAFTSNKLTEIRIPNSLKSIGNNAFRNNVSNGEVILRTPNGNNPNNLPSEKQRHVVDPYDLTIEFVDQEGNKVFADKQVVIRDSNTTTYRLENLPYVPGYYIPDPVDIQLDRIGNSMTYKIVYKKLSPQDAKKLADATSSINFKQFRVDNTVHYIGDEMLSRIAFNLSGYDTSLSNGSLELHYNPDILEPVRIGKSTLINNSQITDGLIKINLKTLSPGSSLDVPITWKFKKYVTPENTPINISAIAKDSGGQIIAQTDDISFVGYYNKPQMTKSIRRADQYGYLEVATDFTNGLPYEEIIEYSFNIVKLERNIGVFTITDSLPEYEAVDGSKKLAVFLSEDNPGWVLSVDGKTATYTGNAYNSLKVEIPSLKLRMPGAKDKHNIRNEVRTQLIPYNKPNTEEPINLYSRSVNYLLEKKTDPGQNPGQDPAYVPSNKFSKNTRSPRWDRINEEAYFIDVQEDRDKEFSWNIHYEVVTQDLTNYQIIDDGLDSRLYYSGFSLPKALYGTSVKVFDNQGNELWKTVVTNGDKVDFPENIRKKIASISFYKDNSFDEKFERGQISIYTRLREPDKIHFDTSPSSIRNIMENSARITKTYTSGTRDLQDKARILIKGQEQIIRARKTSTFESNQRYFSGDKGTYTVGVEMLSETIGDRMQDFELIDLLPKGVNIVAIRLRNDFKFEPTHKMEVIDNYNNSGQTAIVFTADNLAYVDYPIFTAGSLIHQMPIADIDVELDVLVEEGTFTNDSFLKVSNPNFHINNKVDDPRLPETGYSKASVSSNVVRTKEMVAKKEIRRLKPGENLWSSSGIYTDSNEKFEYRLRLLNGGEVPRSNIVLLDVFPYENDKSLVQNQSGQRISRHSEFVNRFDWQKGVQAPPGFKVSYLNQAFGTISGYIDDYEQALNWEDIPTENTTAFKVESPAGFELKQGEELSIIVPMIAPANDDLSLSGKRAYNTFVRKDSITTRFLEPNRVYNEMFSPEAGISLTKIGPNDDNTAFVSLQGAIFELRTSDGQFIDRQESDLNGKVVFTGLDILKDYEIKEVKAPDGYELSTNVIKVKSNDLKNANGYLFDLGQVKNFKKLYPIEPIQGDIKLRKINILGQPLRGVSFTIKGLDNWNRDIYREIKTNSNGQLTFEALPQGKYEIEEIQTLGLLLTNYKIQVSINQLDQVLDLGDIVNDKARLKINKLSILEDKKDISLNLLQGLDGLSLPGAEFEVYDNLGRVVQTVTTDSNGDAWLDNLEVGKIYSLKESKVPDKHSILHNEIKFQINPNGDLLDENGNTLTNRGFLYVPNLREKEVSSVKIEKLDSKTSLGLGGAEFVLYKQKEDQTLEEYARATTDAQGMVSFDNLTGGVYELKEVKAPLGYVVSNKVDIIIVDDYESKDFTYKYENTPLDLNVRKLEPIEKAISKARANELIIAHPNGVISKDGTMYNFYIPLAGATFDLFNKDVGIKLGTYTSDLDGKLNIDAKNLDSTINYSIVETHAPNGYVLNTRPYDLNIEDYTKIVDFDGTINMVIENKAIKGKIIISKYDKSTNTSLKGARFTLYDENMQSLDNKITDDNGSAIFTNLDLGTYYIQEVGTPGGKRISGDNRPRKIVLNSAQNIVTEIYYNEPIEVLPETGGPGNQLIRATGIGLALVALTIFIFLDKKKKRKWKEG